MKNQFAVVLFLLILRVSAEHAQHKVHIVYVGEHSEEKTLGEIEDTHLAYLTSVKTSKEDAKASLVYSYKNVINGFSAWLTPDEASKLSEMEEVVSVFPSQPRYSLQTTRSWDFVNELEGGGDLNYVNRGEELLRKAKYGKDVVVGVLDSGVWPESQSFSDQGMEPIPKYWKGICQTGIAFNASNCNRKIIGARYYLKGYEAYYGPLNNTEDYRSPRDKDGHGTHTASIAGGRRVPNVSLLGGLATGTASGGAPLVRLAIYKVCWPFPGQSKAFGNVCFDEDMLAAFDEAIKDGVNLLSVSIVPFDLRAYAEDSIAIGSFHAVKRNIVVACSGGNTGPGLSTVKNVAPWIMTVGASSIDRIFPSQVLLGNGMKIEGQTATPYKLKRFYPLVYAGDVEVPGSTTKEKSGYCLGGTLSPNIVKGKIVLCQEGHGANIVKGLEVKRAGGVGFILMSPETGIGISVVAHVLPGTSVFSNDSSTILSYVKSYQNPVAKIDAPTTILNSKPAPIMASFSSMGPNGLEPNILKPDITAPGLNILAAWSGGSSPTKLAEDDRIVEYNILSGTSMSCPHVAAAAALLKAVHPDWSSAAIRSALMTTAGTKNNMGEPISDVLGKEATPFSYGAGHFQPAKAADPGLVYDATYNDYLLFLCNTGANTLEPKFQCPKSFPSASNLNYPSLAVSGLNGTVVVQRTVTNVGYGNVTYNSTLKAPPGYHVKISPRSLYFKNLGEKKSFTITITPTNGATKDAFAFGWYLWSDGNHYVRSPIAVSVQN